jgi:hypothetical protein
MVSSRLLPLLIFFSDISRTANGGLATSPPEIATKIDTENTVDIEDTTTTSNLVIVDDHTIFQTRNITTIRKLQDTIGTDEYTFNGTYSDQDLADRNEGFANRFRLPPPEIFYCDDSASIVMRFTMSVSKDHSKCSQRLIFLCPV